MQSFNPYLPLREYVPDGEPHVFGERVYVYGSHDRFGGTRYCMNDYVGWSADVHDLNRWRYEGVICRKEQDPRMKDGNGELWAPDVVKGYDGRYYLDYWILRYGAWSVIIDNSGIMAEKEQNRALILYGNNHGGIERINGTWYVFYHRHTNRTQFSRQGCAEPVVILENGRIMQAEMTSRGFHQGPLEGAGTYPASIACILHGENEPGISGAESEGQPYITQDIADVTPEEVEMKGKTPQQYIADIGEGAVIGYKYFCFQKFHTISVKVRGCAEGSIYIKICGEEETVCQIALKPSQEWTEFSADAVCGEQTGSLLFTYHGSGTFDFLEFSL